MLKYRHPTTEDISKIDAWVKVDSDHATKCDGSFFVELPNADGSKPKGVTCIEVQDDDGTIFYLKFRNAVIVDAQFSPETSETERLRLRKALSEAFGYFGAAFKNMGYHAMFFESTSDSLIKFFSRFGFKKILDTFKVDL